MQFITGIMEQHEGRKLLEELMALEVSAYRIYHVERIASPTTVKAWLKGWWNPDSRHTDKLFELKLKVKNEQRGRKV